MTEENLKQSITLIGPSCVGKSLISNELSKKTGMVHICLDDLLVMIEYEMNGWVGPDEKSQKNFEKILLRRAATDPKLRRNFLIPKFEKKTNEMIHDIIELYNSYLKLFWSLKPFYEILERYQFRFSLSPYPIEKLINLNAVSAELLEKVTELLDQPIILDAPAPLGWKVKDEELNFELEQGELKRSGEIKFEKVEATIDNFLDQTCTVLLCPGIDYDKRNTVRYSNENNVLLAHLDDYVDNADIQITTNALFNEPDNKFLQKRSWLNAEESMEREKLKNQCEINNICDQILAMRDELNAGKTIN